MGRKSIRIQDANDNDMDFFGIPRGIKYHKMLKADKNIVLKHFRELDAPYFLPNSSNGYTHICLICSEKIEDMEFNYSLLRKKDVPDLHMLRVHPLRKWSMRKTEKEHLGPMWMPNAKHLKIAPLEDRMVGFDMDITSSVFKKEYDRMRLKMDKSIKKCMEFYKGLPFLHMQSLLYAKYEDSQVIVCSVQFYDPDWNIRQYVCLVSVHRDELLNVPSEDLSMLALEKLQSAYGKSWRNSVASTASEIMEKEKKVMYRVPGVSEDLDVRNDLMFTMLRTVLGLEEMIVKMDVTLKSVKVTCKHTVTKGGEFTQGLRILNKVGAIHAYFKNSEIAKALRIVQSEHSLPFHKTNASGCVDIIRQTILHYEAYAAYLCKYNCIPLSDMTDMEWNTLRELEALIHLIPVHLDREHRITESFKVFVLHHMQEKLYNESLPVLCWSQSDSTNIVRENLCASNCSLDGITAWNRFQAVVERHIQSMSIPMASFCDPRIKDCISTLISASMYESMVSKFKKYHRIVYKTLHPSTNDEDADLIIDTWLAHTIDWRTEFSSTSQGQQLETSVGFSSPWNIFFLHDQFDLPIWFQRVGQQEFPSIALFARMHLLQTNYDGSLSAIILQTDLSILQNYYMTTDDIHPLFFVQMNNTLQKMNA